MSNKEILEKAIKLAIERGWQFPWSQDYFKPKLDAVDNPDFGPSIWNHGDYEDWDEVRWQEIILNHSFCKALWGEQKWEKESDGTLTTSEGEVIPIAFGDVNPRTGWRYHLQQMVVSDDPIKYLGENI